jgi:hypothetical protein
MAALLRGASAHAACARTPISWAARSLDLAPSASARERVTHSVNSKHVERGGVAAHVRVLGPEEWLP